MRYQHNSSVQWEAGANRCYKQVLYEAEEGAAVHRPFHGSALGPVLAWAEGAGLPPRRLLFQGLLFLVSILSISFFPVL
jgi:hypothetical protein